MSIIIDGAADTISGLAVGGLPNGVITTDDLANGAVTPVKTQTGATPSMIRVNGPNGFGSTNTAVRRWSTVVVNQGSDITYADSATLGGSFTINTAGVYSISYTDAFGAASDFVVSLNATLLTGIPSTLSEILFEATTGTASYRACTGGTVYLPAGSIIRGQTGGSGSSRSFFTITRVA